MSAWFAKIKVYARAHKLMSTIVVLILAIGAYYGYKDANTPPTVTKYVVQAATTGSVVASVSGTGQVQAGTTIQVTPKVSEEVTSIPATVGEHVSAGQLLVQLDATNEEQAVRQDQLALEQAQLNQQESEQVATTTLLQDQNSVTTGQQSVVNASNTLSADYQTDFSTLGSTFVNLQNIMSGMQAFDQGNDINKSQDDPDAIVGLMPSYLQPQAASYQDTFVSDYNLAVSAYQQNLVDYHALSSNSSSSAMDTLFTETYGTAQTVANAVKAGKDFLNNIINTYPASSSTKPLPNVVYTYETNFGNYANTMSSMASGLQGNINQIASDKNNIINTQNSLNQASETLSELIAGPTQTTVLSQQISVQSAQNNLETAEDNLADTSVRAPISGVVSAISAVVGENAGSDAVTIVGDGQVAEITLNEIDAAKVNLGDPATLTFDALPDLSLAGQVVEIDPVGTVSQGVVSYNVQISFSQPADTSSSEQVKPGMSVSVNIVTQSDQNVIAVPNAAVVTSGSNSYVLEPATPLSNTDLATSQSGGIEIVATKQVPVTTGLSNDTETEITSGVNEGDQIIVQTVKSSASSASTASGGGNALQLLGGGAARTGAGFTGGAGGGTFRTGAGGATRVGGGG